MLEQRGKAGETGGFGAGAAFHLPPWSLVFFLANGTLPK